jgi:hypothetical protein
MDITDKNLFSININRNRKSYVIISIDWTTKRITTSERYINEFGESEVMLGKGFIDVGNGNINDDLSIKHVDTGNKTTSDYDDEIKEIEQFSTWEESKYEIINHFVDRNSLVPVINDLCSELCNKTDKDLGVFLTQSININADTTTLVKIINDIKNHLK